MGNLKVAENYLTDAKSKIEELALYTKEDNIAELADIFVSMGVLEVKKSNLEERAENQASSHRQNHADMESSLNNLGVLY